MEERDIAQILKHDFSVGTEAFRDKLLQRCLDTLRSANEETVIDDSDLEMLAAAGDPSLRHKIESNQQE